MSKTKTKQLDLSEREPTEIASHQPQEIFEQLATARVVDETLMIEENLPDFVLGLYEVTDPESGETIYVNSKGKRQTKDGREIPDPTPMAPPLGYKDTPSMFEQMRALIHSEKLKAAAEEMGVETPEEGDDFDVGDDYDPSSPYEHNFDPPKDIKPMSVDELTKRLSRTTQSSEVPLSSGAPGAPAPEGVQAAAPGAAPSAPSKS